MQWVAQCCFERNVMLCFDFWEAFHKMIIVSLLVTCSYHSLDIVFLHLIVYINLTLVLIHVIEENLVVFVKLWKWSLLSFVSRFCFFITYSLFLHSFTIPMTLICPNVLVINLNLLFCFSGLKISVLILIDNSCKNGTSHAISSIKERCQLTTINFFNASDVILRSWQHTFAGFL